MDGKYQNNLNDWIDYFNRSASVEDSQHIDTIFKGHVLSKEHWIDIAFNLFKEASNYIYKNGYCINLILAIYLNDKETPSKHFPRKLSYHNYANQATPPELYLVKDPLIIKEWAKTWKPLNQLSIYYNRKAPEIAR